MQNQEKFLARRPPSFLLGLQTSINALLDEGLGAYIDFWQPHPIVPRVWRGRVFRSLEQGTLPAAW